MFWTVGNFVLILFKQAVLCILITVLVITAILMFISVLDRNLFWFLLRDHSSSSRNWNFTYSEVEFIIFRFFFPQNILFWVLIQIFVWIYFLLKFFGWTKFCSLKPFSVSSFRRKKFRKDLEKNYFLFKKKIESNWRISHWLTDSIKSRIWDTSSKCWYA